MRWHLIFTFRLLVLFLTGCAAVGPDYVPPEKITPEKFNAALSEDQKAKLSLPETEQETDEAKTEFAKQVTPAMLADWWNTLEDPLLTQLIEWAIRGNLDLQLAQSRLREERASRGIARSGLFPTIEGGAAFARQKSSGQSGSGNEVNLYSSGFDASWEIDLFGGIRRSIESAQASVEARQEELNDTLVTLVAEVAINYIEIRAFQARLEAAVNNLESQDETLQIVQNRLDAGLTSTLSLEQAKYNLENTKSEIPTLQTGIEQGKNGLAVLLGEYPGTLAEALEQYQKIPTVSIEVAVGVPADLLRRRPDVRRAERELAAQTAQIGVATADLYPRLFLFGSVGLESISAASFFTGPAAAFQLGPQITWPVFNAGRIRQNINVQSEQQNQALIQYEASVLTAVKDVENALIDFANEQVRRQALIKSTQSAKSAVSLSRELYTAGLTDFIGVLDAERALFSFQDQLAVSEGKVTSNLIRLYKSLGGGWKPLMQDAPQAVLGQQ